MSIDTTGSVVIEKIVLLFFLAFVFSVGSISLALPVIGLLYLIGSLN